MSRARADGGGAGPSMPVVGHRRTVARMSRSINLAVIPGDGIGPEVVVEGLKVLDAVLGGSDAKVETTEYDLGARRWRATGETLPDSVLAELRRSRRDPARRGRRPRGTERSARAGLAAQASFRAGPLRQPSPGSALPGRRLSAARPGRDRLRGSPGRHRGALRRQWRRSPRRHAGRDRERGECQHRVRRRAGGA